MPYEWYKAEHEEESSKRIPEEIEAEKDALKNLVDMAVEQNEEEVFEKMLENTYLLSTQIDKINELFYILKDPTYSPEKSFKETKAEFIKAMSNLEKLLIKFSEHNPSIQAPMSKFNKVFKMVQKFLEPIQGEKDVTQLTGQMWDEIKKVLIQSIADIDLVLAKPEPQKRTRTENLN